jgi:uncharacterized repeat protein (TIGR02543 family)
VGGNAWVQHDGTLGAAAEWLPPSVWGLVTVTGLAHGTTYSFQAKARNAKGTETGFGPAATGTTRWIVTFQAGANGVLVGGSPQTQTVPPGANCGPVTADPAFGYGFANWTGTVGFTSATIAVTVTNVTQDMTITANFADIAPPTVANRVPAPSSTLGSTAVAIDVTFSEVVQGVAAADLVLSGAAAGSASVGLPTDQGGSTWRFPLSGLVNGTLNVSLAAAANDIEDLAGNDLAPLSWSYTVAASVSATPGVPDLLPGSDLGASDTDDLTSLNNSTVGSRLQFAVSGTIPEPRLGSTPAASCSAVRWLRESARR